MAVVEGPGGGEHTVRGEKRIQASDLVDTDDVHAEADALRVAQDVFEPGELGGIVGEAQAAARVPARVLAGERLEPWIERVAIGVDLGEVVAAGNAWALAGGVPGRAGGELVFFDQEGVGAALESEMVEQTCAHHPAADDDDACVCFH